MTSLAGALLRLTHSTLRKPAVCCLLCAVSCLPASPLSAEPVDRREPTAGYSAIQRAFLREDFESSEALAGAFVTENPRAPETTRVWIWLALSLDRLQRSSDALSELERMKARLPSQDPLWPEVLFWEGEVSRRALQMVRAKLAYQRLVAQYPASTWASQAHLGLGLIDLHQQAFEPALKHFEAVASAQPGTPAASDARRFAGLCDLKLNRFDQAADIFRALLNQPQSPDAAAQLGFYLGESLSGLGRYEEAVPVYRRALESAASSSWGRLAQFGLGWASYQAGRCGESLKAFDAYLTGGAMEHEPEALFAQAGCLVRLDQAGDASAKLETLRARYAGHPLARAGALLLIDGYRRQGRLALAKTRALELLREPLEPGDRAEASLRLGVIALEEGDAQQAQTAFQAAHRVHEPLIAQAALGGLADVELYLGRAERAQQLYEEAIALAPHTPQSDYARLQAGRIQAQQGSLERAVEMFRLVTSSPDLTLADDARLALVAAYLSRHRDELARAALDVIHQPLFADRLAARSAYYEALLALGQDDQAAARRLCETVVAQAGGTEEAFNATLLLADLTALASSPRDAANWLRERLAPARMPRAHRARLAKRFGDVARGEQAYAEAIGWYEEAMTWLPSLSGEISYWIASCYEAAGDVELARRWYQRVDQTPWHVRGKLALAKLLEREDRLEEAEAIYRAMSGEPIPEAKLVQERLLALERSQTVATQ